MTRKVTRFNFNEVKRFRINCKKCNTTIEVDTDNNEKIINGYCPFCNTYLYEEEGARALILKMYDSFKLSRELKNISIEMEFEEKE